MTRRRQFSSLDAVTLAHLTSNFDPLPGGVWDGDPWQTGLAGGQAGPGGAAGAEPIGPPPAEVAGHAPAGNMGVLAARAPLAADALASSSAAERREPADGSTEPAEVCAALRSWLDSYGHCELAPPEPPWTDPRPDLKGDHGRWTVLLALAWANDGLNPYGVYGALYGVRCCGAAIVTDVQPLDLSPAGPPLYWRLTRGEMPEPEWQACRAQWLQAHRDVLVRLLKGGDGR